MSTITLRLVKGAPLTNQEVDDNFANLNNDKYEAGDSASLQDLTLSGMSGPIAWNVDDGALDIPLNADVTLQTGQEFVFYAKATEAISNGDVVMFAGAQGGHLLIAKADLSATGFDPTWIVGVATQDFAINEFGYTTALGKVRDLDTSLLAEGDILYVDPNNAGAYTTTKPSAPTHIIQIAAVVRSHGTQGAIQVRVTHIADTDEVPEGATNLYFTDARAVAAIKADADWNATNWDTAYGWGNHASAGYLTSYTETDPTVPSHVKSITTTDISQWDTAYGWGNHASAGYLTSASLTGYATQTYVNNAVSDLVDSAPATLDTLNELAAALGDDPNFATTVTNSIATKANKSGDTFTGDVHIDDADLIVSRGTNSYRQADHIAYFGGSSLDGGDASIYIGNRGDGTGYGWELFYQGTGSGNNNKFIIRSENLGSEVDALTFTQDGNATFSGTISASGYNKSNWDTAYDYSQVGHLPLSGGTVSGQTTFNGHVNINPNGTALNFNSDGSRDTIVWKRNGTRKWGLYHTDSNTLNFTPADTATNNVQINGNRILTVADEGSGNGLDADTVDGLHASSFASASHTHSYLPLSGGVLTGSLSVNGGADINIGATAGGDMGDLVWRLADGTEKHRLWDGGTGLQYRYNGSGANKLFHDAYHPNADKWTTARTHTVTLTGDVSGTASQSVDGTGNKTWSISTTVGDNSHRHDHIYGGSTWQTIDLNTIANQAGSGELRYEQFSSSSTNAPPMHDNANGVITVGQHSSNYSAQLAFSSDGKMYHRDNPAGSHGSWQGVFTDAYHPNADKWTTARTNTVTLTGDVTGSGSASVDGTGNWTVSINSNLTVSSTDTFTGTYPIAWLASDNLYKCSWLEVNGATDTLETRNISANGTITATSFSGNLDYNDITNPPVIDNSVDYINSASFNTSNGVLTLSGVGRAGATVDLDNRYLTSYTETDTLQSVTNRGNTTTQQITAAQYRYGDGNWVKPSTSKWVAGYSDNFSSGSTGWKTIAKIRLTTDCAGDTLYGNIYENAYHDARVHQIAIVARAECNFRSNNESHVIEVGCTTIASSNDYDYRNKIRVELVESSTNSRTYELQIYETSWNDDKWELVSRQDGTGNNVWTKYTSGQTIGTSTGTSRVSYQSRLGADQVHARDGMYARTFYDRDDASYYVDPASTSRLNAVNANSYQVSGTTVINSNKNIEFVRASSGTLASRTGFSDFIGYNPSYGSYIGGGVNNAGNYIYAGGYISKGGIHTLWHSGNDGSGSGLDADLLDGIDSTRFTKLTSQIGSGDFNTIFNTGTQFRTQISQVANITNGNYSNHPTGVYTYGSVLNWRVENSTFQLYTSHTGDLVYRTGWNNDGYSGWRRVLNTGYYGAAWTSGNDGSGSGLDADLLDGVHASSFVRSDADDTVTGALNFTKTSNHAIQVGTIRGRAVGSQTGQYIHLYDRVHIGSPNGWGSKGAPSYGLSTYGGADFCTDTGSVRIGDSISQTHGGLQIYRNGGVPSTSGYSVGNGAHIELYANNNPVLGFHNSGNSACSLYEDAGDLYLTRWNGTATGSRLWHSNNDGAGSGLDADLLDGQHGSYYDHRAYTSTSNYLGGHYTSGGYEVPTSSALGAGKLKLIMLRGSNVGGGAWNDCLWMSAYTGSDVKKSTLLVSSKYDNTSLRICKQNYDSSSFGTSYLFWNSGNDGSGSGLDADLLDGVQGGSYLRSDTNDTFTGNLTTGADNHITFGPNSSWASYLRIGGNGRTVSGAGAASVVTTNGNLHLDAGDASDRGIYLNYYAGGHGTIFGNGNGGIVARMDTSGNLYKASSATNSTATYWHSANDGSGSGLDADLLDGQNGSYYDQSQFTGASFYSSNSGSRHSNLEASTYNNVGYIYGSNPSSYSDGSIYTAAYSSSWVSQIFADYRSGNFWTRTKNSGTWQSFNKIWTAGNDGSGSGLDADTVDGLHASAFASASHTHDTLYVRQGGTSFNGEYPMVVRVSDRNFYSDGNIRFEGATSKLTVDGSVVTGTGSFSGKVDFQGDAAIEGGSGYGIFKGYTSNNNHMIVVRGAVSGSGSSPTIVGDHQTTFVEFMNPRDETSGWFFKDSYTNGAYTYSEIARITTTGVHHGSSMRAPIFYDSNDTTCYINPQGSSQIKGELNIRENASASGYTFMRFQALTSGATLGSIYRQYGSMYYSTNSDYRLKENVVDLSSATERVRQLQPKRFNFIDYPEVTIDGFIAHEVSDVVPEAVIGEKDAVDSYGNPDHQSLDASKLVPLLTAALQEALDKIDALESRIEALETSA